MDSDAVAELPKNVTDISHMLNSVTLTDIDEDIEFAMLEGIPGVDNMLDGLQTTYFASRIPSAPREIEIIRAWENNPNLDESNTNEELTHVLNWLGNGSSPLTSITLLDYLIWHFHHCSLKGRQIGYNREGEMSIYMSMQSIFSDIVITDLEGTLASDIFY